jgi:hypothetical protein
VRPRKKKTTDVIPLLAYIGASEHNPMTFDDDLDDAVRRAGGAAAMARRRAARHGSSWRRALAAARRRASKAGKLWAQLARTASGFSRTRVRPWCGRLATTLLAGRHAGALRLGRFAHAACTGGRRLCRRHGRSAWRQFGFVPSFGIGTGLLTSVGACLLRDAHPLAFGSRCGGWATVLGLGLALMLRATFGFLRALETR